MNNENKTEYKYSGITDWKYFGYNSLYDCYLAELSEYLKGEMPEKELKEFLINKYNPDSNTQEFEINGNKVHYVFV